MTYNRIISHYFQEKLKATFFKIMQKTPILGKTEFSSKFCSDQFFSILTKNHSAQFFTKTNEQIPSNTDVQMVGHKIDQA